MDLSKDRLLGVLPTDSTLIIGADIRQLAERPHIIDAINGEPGRIREMSRLLESLTGMSSGINALERFRIGCGSGGCALLAEGNLSGLSAQTTAQNMGVQQVTLVPAFGAGLQQGVDGRLKHGEPVSARHVAANRLVVGDRRAVQKTVAKVRAQHKPTAPDSLPWRASVPQGDFWMVAARANTFLSQLLDRLAQNNSEQASKLINRIRNNPKPIQIAARRAEAIALSVDLQEPAHVRLRITCVDKSAANQVATLLQAAMLGGQLNQSQRPALRQAIAETRVAQVGRLVELSLSDDIQTLRSLLRELGEHRQ